MEPLLSVVTITYNHEPYIEKCIKGVLMQRVNFPIEFIIAEDCSADGTRRICEKYAAEYPELIRLITSDHNIGYNPNELRAMKAAKGKYIAYCEGDDYWTDPDKLQKQFDFLESHPEYSVCFHNRVVERGGWLEADDTIGQLCVSGCGFDCTVDLFFSKWVTYPFSMVLRRNLFDISLYFQYKYFRDTHMIFHLLQKGKAYVFLFVGGVRTIHSDSLFHSMARLECAETDMKVMRELYNHNKTSKEKHILRREYAKRIRYYLQVSLEGEHISRLKLIMASMHLFFLDHSLKCFAYNLYSVFCK